MFIAQHLVLGLVTGLGIYALTGSRNAVLVALAAAILPDIIDKGIGWGIFRELYHNGRIYSHALLAVAVLLALALILLVLHHRDPGILACAAGASVLVHQLADQMWTRPVEWFWPLLGPMPRHRYVADYLLKRVIADVATPAEWVLAGVVIAVLYLLWRFSYSR